MTNADKIRQMTDEEMAIWIHQNAGDLPCILICFSDCTNFDLDDNKVCPKIIEWLKAEAEE